MWIPLVGISENSIEAGGRWSSEPLFIGKIFSPSPNFPHSKEEPNFLRCSLVVDIS
jgi:hypothetical protein